MSWTPCVGLMAYKPARVHGVMMEPMVSDPTAKGAKPAATATAEPVDEPPGAYQGSASSPHTPSEGDESRGI